MNREIGSKHNRHVRVATGMDAGEVLALVQEYYAFDHIPFHESAIRAALKLLLEDSSFGEVLLLESNGTSAGYCILTFGFDLEFGGRVVTVTDLYVRPRFRWQGLGTMLLSRVEETCRSLNIHAFELQVETQNSAAQGFYLKWGLEKHDRIPMSKRID
jgi:GNAT superfamily N-acetyltransferase